MSFTLVEQAIALVVKMQYPNQSVQAQKQNAINIIDEDIFFIQ
jgi:hypothetical protein